MKKMIVLRSLTTHTLRHTHAKEKKRLGCEEIRNSRVATKRHGSQMYSYTHTHTHTHTHNHHTHTHTHTHKHTHTHTPPHPNPTCTPTAVHTHTDGWRSLCM